MADDSTTSQRPGSTLPIRFCINDVKLMKWLGKMRFYSTKKRHEKLWVRLCFIAGGWREHEKTGGASFALHCSTKILCSLRLVAKGANGSGTDDSTSLCTSSIACSDPASSSLLGAIVPTNHGLFFFFFSN